MITWSFMIQTSTAKQDLKGLLKETYERGILKVDHSGKVDCMTDGEALGLVILNGILLYQYGG
ncbi:hypothetical protein ACQKII_23750 [Lysinibacillus sp. NPDC048646]|uniref:hypothetical protein n=1 Tax=Lysinibacillus sp. NPDC048646 TaxID=3390574 RepID=UPI003D08F967